MVKEQYPNFQPRMSSGFLVIKFGLNESAHRVPRGHGNMKMLRLEASLCKSMICDRKSTTGETGFGSKRESCKWMGIKRIRSLMK